MLKKFRLPFNLELISIEEEGMCRKLFITPLSFTDLTFWYVLLICKLYFGCSLKVSSTLLPSFFGVWDDMKTFLAKDVGCTNYIGKSVIQQHDVVQVKKTGKKIHIRVIMLPASLCPLLKTNVMIYTEKKRFNNESRTQQPDFFENPTEKQILPKLQ